MNESTPPQRNSNDLNDRRKGLPAKFAKHCQRCGQRLQGILESTVTHRSQSIDELEATSELIQPDDQPLSLHTCRIYTVWRPS